MKSIALVLIASVTLCAPALAEDVIVKSPSIGVTVGSGPDRVVREREVVRERDPRVEKKVIIEKERRPGCDREEDHHQGRD